MGEAGIVVTWQMPPEDIQAIARVQQRAGVDQMVTFALKTKATAREPIRFATYFVKAGWLGLPPATTPPKPKPQPDAGPAHCGDPDCDPVTRTREIEDDRGIRSLTRCPACNPHTKGHAA